MPRGRTGEDSDSSGVWRVRIGIGACVALVVVVIGVLLSRVGDKVSTVEEPSDWVAETMRTATNAALVRSEVSRCPTLTGRWRLVNTFRHDSTAFTQGLAFVPERGTLLESTGLYGHSNLREVDYRTGKVLRSSKTLPRELFGEGIALVPTRKAWSYVGRLVRSAGGNVVDSAAALSTLPLDKHSLVHLTWKNGHVLVWDPSTFERTAAMPFETTTNQGWGITLDLFRRVLLVSDGSEWLHEWDPWTLQEKKRVRVLEENGHPVRQLNELEWVCGEVLSNIWFDDRVARIDPESGAVKGFIDFSALNPKAQRPKTEDVLNGIAVDMRTVLHKIPRQESAKPRRTAETSQETSSSASPSSSSSTSSTKEHTMISKEAVVGNWTVPTMDPEDPVSKGTWGGGVRVFVTGKKWRHLYEVALETTHDRWD